MESLSQILFLNHARRTGRSLRRRKEVSGTPHSKWVSGTVLRARAGRDQDISCEASSPKERPICDRTPPTSYLILIWASTDPRTTTSQSSRSFGRRTSSLSIRARTILGLNSKSMLVRLRTEGTHTLVLSPIDHWRVRKEVSRREDGRRSCMLCRTH